MDSNLNQNDENKPAKAVRTPAVKKASAKKPAVKKATAPKPSGSKLAAKPSTAKIPEVNAELPAPNQATSQDSNAAPPPKTTVSKFPPAKAAPKKPTAVKSALKSTTTKTKVTRKPSAKIESSPVNPVVAEESSDLSPAPKPAVKSTKPALRKKAATSKKPVGRPRKKTEDQSLSDNAQETTSSTVVRRATAVKAKPIKSTVKPKPTDDKTTRPAAVSELQESPVPKKKDVGSPGTELEFAL